MAARGSTAARSDAAGFDLRTISDLAHAPEDKTRSRHHGAGVPGRRTAFAGLCEPACCTPPCSSPTTPTAWAREQIWLALEHALESGLKDRTVDPNDPASCARWWPTTVRNSDALQAVVDSVNRYFAHRLRHQHRRQPGQHAAQQQSRQRRPARCPCGPTTASFSTPTPCS